MVTLRNNTDRRQIFELPHSVVCTEDECICVPMVRSSRELNAATGEYGTRVEEGKSPSSIILGARATSKPLPDLAVDVPAIAAALASNALVRA